MYNYIFIKTWWYILALFFCLSCSVLCRANTTNFFLEHTFQADTAYYFIQKQVSLGPRVPNTIAHQICSQYLAKTLQQYGGQVHLQNFTTKAFNGKLLNLTNIIAKFNIKATKRILLAAHWDTRPFADKSPGHHHKPIAGANDGASGVGILLEIARLLHSQKEDSLGIDIVFFDGEDYGPKEGDKKYDNKASYWCLGSQYWAKNIQDQYLPMYGILLDMVGARKACFYRDWYSMHYASKLVHEIWQLANQYGYQQFKNKNSVHPIMDDHLFVNKIGIPMICIIDGNGQSKNFFSAYHHTLEDDIQLIDHSTLQAVGDVLWLWIIRQKKHINN